jgi:hypothetical protein
VSCWPEPLVEIPEAVPVVATLARVPVIDREEGMRLVCFRADEARSEELGAVTWRGRDVLPSAHIRLPLEAQSRRMSDAMIAVATNPASTITPTVTRKKDRR